MENCVSKLQKGPLGPSSTPSRYNLCCNDKSLWRYPWIFTCCCPHIPVSVLGEVIPSHRGLCCRTSGVLGDGCTWSPRKPAPVSEMCGVPHTKQDWANLRYLLGKVPHMSVPWLITGHPLFEATYFSNFFPLFSLILFLSPLHTPSSTLPSFLPSESCLRLPDLFPRGSLQA